MDAKKGAMSVVFILITVLFSSQVIADTHTYFFAGCHVGPESDAFMTVLNPNEERAELTITFFYEKNKSTVEMRRVDPHSTALFDLSNLAPPSVFGVKIDSDLPVAVQHAQFDGTYSGGFGSVAAPATDKVWYFAEGYTSGNVKTYLSLLNPSDVNTDVTITLYYEGGEKKVFRVDVPAKRHVRLDLKERTMPEKRFGIHVVSTVPIVAETSNYNKRFSAGSGGIGSNALSKTLHFPSGRAGVEETDFINIVNPSRNPAEVKVTVYYEDGEKHVIDEEVPQVGKKMIMLNNYVELDRSYSAVVESDVAVAAEITHYDDARSAGYGYMGIAEPVKSAYFGKPLGAESYLAVFNPAPKDAVLELTFYYADGEVKTLTASAKGQSRSTVDLDAVGMKNRVYGIRLVSSAPVFVVQESYEERFSAGYGTAGSSLPLDVAMEADSEEKSGVPGIVGDAVLSEVHEFSRVDREDVSPSRFKSSVSGGLEGVVKSTYYFGDAMFVVWEFDYADASAAGAGVEGAVAGGLFTILEISETGIKGRSAYHFIAEKSEGFIVQDGELMLVAVGGKGDPAMTEELTASLLSGEDAPERGGWSFTRILLVIAALLIFIVLIRWLFRRTEHGDEFDDFDDDFDDEDYAWKEEIPSAVPPKKTSEKSPAKKKVKAAKPAAKPAAEKKPAPKKEEDASKPEKEAVKVFPRPEKRGRGRPKKKSPEELEAEDARKFRVREKPDHEKTAQDFLDELEDIPDYEDVFRHVNREHEEIKPK
ncbi:hypothetical protein KY362_06020 [Candidatus Woesearchaeota archaeon]|nr:hypothetical protein [Candidatus Woesearchaeota archaeon]